MKEVTWDCVLHGGPHDGYILDGLYGDIALPLYRKTDIHDEQGRVIFQFVEVPVPGPP